MRNKSLLLLAAAIFLGGTIFIFVNQMQSNALASPEAWEAMLIGSWTVTCSGGIGCVDQESYPMEFTPEREIISIYDSPGSYTWQIVEVDGPSAIMVTSPTTPVDNDSSPDGRYLLNHINEDTLEMRILPPELESSTEVDKELAASLVLTLERD